MESFKKDRLRLIEVVPDAIESGANAKWKVRLGYFDGDGAAPSVEFTFTFDAPEWQDEAILPLAHHCVNRICDTIAKETLDWAFSESELDGLRKKPAAAE